MIQRLALAALRRYIGGPGRSWVFTSVAVLGMRLAKSVIGRREVVDVGDVKPGDRILIEHLDVSHKTQMRAIKAEVKADKVAAKAEKRAAKERKAADNAAGKAAKQARRNERAARRRARRASRAASEASAGG